MRRDKIRSGYTNTRWPASQLPGKRPIEIQRDCGQSLWRVSHRVRKQEIHSGVHDGHFRLFRLFTHFRHFRHFRHFIIGNIHSSGAMNREPLRRNREKREKHGMPVFGNQREQE